MGGDKQGVEGGEMEGRTDRWAQELVGGGGVKEVHVRAVLCYAKL
jgi:hypothetical protein